MARKNREIHDLLADYAGSLRDGSVPVFLKSLTSDEARMMAYSKEFWDSADVVRILNGAGFAGKAILPNVNLFISRLNARIACRWRKLKATHRSRPAGSVRGMSKARRTETSI